MYAELRHQRLRFDCACIIVSEHSEVASHDKTFRKPVRIRRGPATVRGSQRLLRNRFIEVCHWEQR